MIITQTEVIETPLVLGDYVTVHVSDAMASQVNSTEPCDMQVRREELFQRIQKQRGAIFQQVRKPEGKLFDPRHRGAA
jgi:sRNA-binding carbon storage regulator CsrA